MKSLSALIFILSYAAVVHTATTTNKEEDSMAQCLQKYGLKMDDLEFLRKPNTDVPMKNNVIEDKVACALACTFKKKNNHIPVESKKEMLETLNECNDAAKGNDCKLLQCIKVTRNPFMNLVFSYGA